MHKTELALQAELIVKSFRAKMVKENRDISGDFKLVSSNGWKSYGNEYSFKSHGFCCEYIFSKMFN